MTCQAHATVRLDDGYIVMQQPRNLGSLPQPIREPDGALTVFDTEAQALDVARRWCTRDLDCWTARASAWPGAYA